MQRLVKVADVRKWRQPLKSSVGYVPTMGGLHEGHLQLVKNSLKQCENTIVSIFVNPAQFSPAEDLETYPRTLERDLELLASLRHDNRSVSAVFTPTVKDMYPSGISQQVDLQKGTFVEVKGLSHQLEGASRPTFFRGVATIVTKLFNIVQPDWAFFGQKDIQQCIVLRQLIQDLHMPYPSSPKNLVVIPTAREPSGLALSTRNNYLSPAELQLAPVLYEALQTAEATYKIAAQQCENVPAEVILKPALDLLSERQEQAKIANVKLDLDYLTLYDPYKLEPAQTVSKANGALLVAAMWCGKTRLLDNITLNHDMNA